MRDAIEMMMWAEHGHGWSEWLHGAIRRLHIALRGAGGAITTLKADDLAATSQCHECS